MILLWDLSELLLNFSVIILIGQPNFLVARIIDTHRLDLVAPQVRILQQIATDIVEMPFRTHLRNLYRSHAVETARSLVK